MKPKIDIVFVGSSAIGLRNLVNNKDFSVVDVLCLESRMNKGLREAAEKYGYEIKTFKCIRDFRETINNYPVLLPFFIYQLDMLVPGDLTERYNFYNIHRGSLFTNRGPNPDVWPILNGDSQTSLSLHKINDKIDSGILIDTFDVEITKDDDTISIKIKLEKGLPKLIESLKDYLNFKKRGITLTEGLYRPWIKESDFTIDLEKDSLEIIDRKIRSQSQYNGAILIINDQKYYVSGILKCEDTADTVENSMLLHDDKLKVVSGSQMLTFKLNRAPKYQPPPIRSFPVRI
jgi:methionyl-tRNA formyltransferase